MDGKNVGIKKSYSFEKVDTDHSILVSFKKKVYTINHSVSGNGGKINADDGNNSVDHGDNKTYTITPDEGYQIKKVIIDGVAQDDIKNQYTFDSVTKDGHTISVEFEKKSYTINSDGGDHGKITPAGNIKAEYGDSKIFRITPDKGYKIKDVLVDGVSVGAVNKYTFDDINKDHTISVIYEKTDVSGSKNTNTDKNSSKSTSSVKTGDETNFGWLTAALVSLILCTVLLAGKKKRENRG